MDRTASSAGLTPAPAAPSRRAGSFLSTLSARERILPPSRPTLRQLLHRRPLGPQLWAGLVLLAVYLAAALSALVVFRGSLTQLDVHADWLPPPGPPPAFVTLSSVQPSLAHPFGILPGLGVDLFRALWQATPFDLAIVASILALDGLLGWTLGALAGMHEGGPLDSLVTFLGDSLGALPSFFLVIAVFAGLATVAPSDSNLLSFVLLFGLLLWPATARTTRDRARLVAREPFLEASRAAGASPARLYFRHILPNSLAPLLAQIPIDLAPIFFVLTVFPWFWNCASFRPPPPPPPPTSPSPYFVPTLPPFSPLPSVNFPEWGNLLAVGTCEGLTTGATAANYWWMYLFPLLAIVGLGFAIAFVCDGLEKRTSRRTV